MRRDAHRPLVKDDTFIMATRETGYRGMASALAELIDNSLQAGATNIKIFVDQNELNDGSALRVSVLDDGVGMDPKTLHVALQFGGSARFGDRSGLGRFGMGLPNSSVSQTKRVDIYSWRAPEDIWHAYLDVTAIASGCLPALPKPRRSRQPQCSVALPTSGTLVIWSHCDRTRSRRVSTVVRQLSRSLGRMYRFFIRKGARISVNGIHVRPLDPLFCDSVGEHPGGSLYGQPLLFELKVPNADATSVVLVRFSELPVAKWWHLSNVEKRRMGITGGAGVSIVRAGREIDYGWYFMGGKRRENYDDWWRCELCFSPDLDELFGVTHSKQGIHPSETLAALLKPDLESTARELNARTRAAFAALAPRKASRAERLAGRRDRYLRPMRTGTAPAQRNSNYSRYQIIARPFSRQDFLHVERAGAKTVIVLNANHPFYTELYSPALDSSCQDERFRIECVLLSAVRAGLSQNGAARAKWVEQLFREWGNAVAAFLR